MIGVIPPRPPPAAPPIPPAPGPPDAPPAPPIPFPAGEVDARLKPRQPPSAMAATIVREPAVDPRMGASNRLITPSAHGRQANLALRAPASEREAIVSKSEPLMLSFDNTYSRLPARFYARVAPTKVGDPRVVKVNRALAELLGASAEELASSAGASVLVGNQIPPGAEPLALAYAGHQFGGFVPQLGDGRAILLGEVIGTDGRRRDVQLKGAGRTPFSRRGDGRAALGPVLREYLVSEAMTALGIPATRALAAVTTGEPVVSDVLLPGAVLTRVAASHLRIGTFFFFNDPAATETLRTLTTYALDRH